MEKITKFCCGRSGSDIDERTPYFVEKSLQLSELSSEPHLQPLSDQHLGIPPLEFCISDEPNCRLLQVKRNNNAFTITMARFSPNGITHNVVIDFKKGGTQMNMNIEGEQLLTIDTKKQPHGNFKFVIDGMFVEFVWNIKIKPMRFLFHTRISITDSSGSSHDGESSDACKSTWHNKKWKRHDEGYTLDIYGV